MNGIGAALLAVLVAIVAWGVAYAAWGPHSGSGLPWSGGSCSNVLCACDNCSCGAGCKCNDVRAAMRKLWSNHATWTKVYIDTAASRGNTEVLVPRLMKNQERIGALVGHFRPDKGAQLAQLLKGHIEAAAATVAAAQRHGADDPATKRAVAAQMANGDQVGYVLESVGTMHAQRMFREHNELVIEQAVAVLSGDAQKAVTLYDRYYNEILAMSDDICEALVTSM